MLRRGMQTMQFSYVTFTINIKLSGIYSKIEIYSILELVVQQQFALMWLFGGKLRLICTFLLHFTFTHICGIFLPARLYSWLYSPRIFPTSFSRQGKGFRLQTTIGSQFIVLNKNYFHKMRLYALKQFCTIVQFFLRKILKWYDILGEKFSISPS